MAGSKNRTAAHLLCAGMFLMFALAAAAGGDHEGIPPAHKHAESAKVGGADPLIEEMRILDSVFREVVSAVAIGDSERVVQALQSMHGTMEKTHEGVHHGTVKMRKNADKRETFITMDKNFHAELEALGAVAKRNDQQAMLTLSKDLLDRCVKCHGMFR